jgi:hypothetical protein
MLSSENPNFGLQPFKIDHLIHERNGPSYIAAGACRACGSYDLFRNHRQQERTVSGEYFARLGSQKAFTAVKNSCSSMIPMPHQ